MQCTCKHLTNHVQKSSHQHHPHSSLLVELPTTPSAFWPLAQLHHWIGAVGGVHDAPWMCTSLNLSLLNSETALSASVCNTTELVEDASPKWSNHLQIWPLTSLASDVTTTYPMQLVANSVRTKILMVPSDSSSTTSPRVVKNAKSACTSCSLQRAFSTSSVMKSRLATWTNGTSWIIWDVSLKSMSLQVRFSCTRKWIQTVTIRCKNFRNRVREFHSLGNSQLRFWWPCWF